MKFININTKQIKTIYTILYILLLCLINFSFNEKNSVKVNKPPNIVLIVVDDLGYGDLGIYGNHIHDTPHMDKLAKEGMIFTEFYSNGAVCSPTRAALMTGQYQQRSGIEHAIGFTMDEGLEFGKTTVAKLLHKAGYTSGVFGKWHLGHVTKYGPNDHGFDQSRVSNNTPDYHTHISRVGEYDWFENQVLKKESGYLTDLVTEHSVQFIHDQKNTPFFLFVSHIAVHFPFQGPNDPAQRTAGQIWHDTRFGPLPESQFRRAYKDMLESVDQSVGKIVAVLEDLELRDNTFIFVTSDNGAYQWVGSNYPLRGEKGELFEGGIKVPAFANWPGKVPAGKYTDALTMTMDLSPTFLTIAGLDHPITDPFDGVDLSPVLFRNEGLEKRILFWRFINPYVDTKAYAVRDEGWKYLVYERENFLFNLKQDKTESNNLIQYYPSIAEELERSYRVWLDDVKRN